MIERVARAIMQAREGCRVTDWREAEWNPAVAQVLSEARAAIAAMREPTAGMVEALRHSVGVNGYGARGAPLAITGMIDAALQEKPEA